MLVLLAAMLEVEHAVVLVVVLIRFQVLVLELLVVAEDLARPCCNVVC